MKIVLAGCGGMSGAWLNVASQMNQAGLIGLIDDFLKIKLSKSDGLKVSTRVIVQSFFGLIILLPIHEILKI